MTFSQYLASFLVVINFVMLFRIRRSLKQCERMAKDLDAMREATLKNMTQADYRVYRRLIDAKSEESEGDDL